MEQFKSLGLKFSSIVSQSSEKVAIRFLSGESVTYQELDELSLKYANTLISLGLKPGDCIAISSEKRKESYGLIVACWKVGVTYSFFDRFSPIKRLKKILDQCNAKNIFGSKEVIKLLEDSRRDQLITYEQLFEKSKNEERPLPQEIKGLSGDTIAYIMFTSGSTGIPKGVAIKHDSLLNFSNWTQKVYNLTSEDRLSHLNPLYFDNSVFDLYASLLIGASITAFNRADLKDPGYVLDSVNELNLTTWFSVPSMIIYLLNLGLVKEDSFKSMKRIIFGGEGFSKGKLKELFELVGDRVQLVNVYGPTEGTCICSTYNVNEFDFTEDQLSTLAPLGKDMLDVFRYHILNESNEEVMDGEIGELALGGPQLSPGYVGNKEETERVFIQDPFSRFSYEKLYKTGDLVVRSPNGFIYFSGRKDSQIKFMGHRVELGEIESALDSLDFIKESCVVFGGRPGASLIVAYVSTDSVPSEIKKCLKNLLPPYMIPRKIKILEVLPKNANGKVDRKKLIMELLGEK